MGYEAFTNARDATLRNVEGSMAALESGRQAGVARRAGNALQSGDYGAASNALYQGGDLQGGLAVQNAGRERQTADRDRQRATIAAAVSGLMHVPAEQRQAMLQSRIAPIFNEMGMGEYLANIRPEDLSDASLRGLSAAMGGEVQDAPSGYRWAEGGAQEYIRGGPADPRNKPWQVTPWGYAPPPGWTPDQIPAGGAAPEYVDALPPGVRPRPNQPLSAPAAGGGERSQPVSVSFQSSRDAQSAIAQLVPGVRVTSGARSPADNRRVGGAAGSYHLQDRARDLVPPAGMTMAQLAAKMRQAGFRALDEGDHVHVSW